MSHLAAYYDPSDSGEQDDQPFLRELADMGNTGVTGDVSPQSGDAPDAPQR